MIETQVSLKRNNFIIDEAKASHGAIASALLLTGKSNILPSIEKSPSHGVRKISSTVASPLAIVNNMSSDVRNDEVPSFPTNTSFIVARDEWKKNCNLLW